MDMREVIIEAGKRMLLLGLTVETWGNISVRDPDTGLIYITPSAMPYNAIAREDVVVLNDKCEVVEGTRKPSIESELHVGILNERKEFNAIIHTHPIYSQVFACLREDIPPVIDEAAQVLAGSVKCAKYGLPGSAELSQNVVETMQEGCACLMANHGAVCAGSDIEAAFRVCTVLEMTAQIYYMARSIGRPYFLDAENVQKQEQALHRYLEMK